jgi:hypothetical protein
MCHLRLHEHTHGMGLDGVGWSYQADMSAVQRVRVRSVALWCYPA